MLGGGVAVLYYGCGVIAWSFYPAVRFCIAFVGGVVGAGYGGLLVLSEFRAYRLCILEREGADVVAACFGFDGVFLTVVGRPGVVWEV